MSKPKRPHTRCRNGLVVATCVAALALCQISPQLAAAEAKTKTVRLTVDYGDGVEVRFKALAWHDGMTVLDALAEAKAHPHGISYSQRGSGRSALVTAIGGAKNQGGGAQSKNWIYYVNDKQAAAGAGAQALSAGDAVLWKYQVYQYNP